MLIADSGMWGTGLGLREGKFPPKSGKLEFKIVCIQSESVLGEEQHHFPKAPCPSWDHCWHPPAEEEWVGEGASNGDRLRPEGGCRSTVCKLSSMGVCPWSDPRPVSSPVMCIYGAGWDPWSLCAHALVAAGHQGCMRSWSDPLPGCIPTPGP